MFLIGNSAWASSAPLTQVSAIQPQSVDFNICNKIFKMDCQKLFFITLAGVNANRFRIDEIKSRSGYVMFTVANRQYLASVVKIDARTSLLKITPCDNVYYFPVGIIQNMFKYVELNTNTQVQRLSVI